MQELKLYGVNTEILSVAKKHYEDFAMLITEERVHGPHNPLLIEELLQLRILKGKVDHPRKGSKDLADAVCGAIYNSIAHTPRDMDREIEVYTYSSLSNDREEYRGPESRISAPSKNVQDSAISGLQNIQML